MKLSDLVFTGFNKRVAALHRNTGQIVWQWSAPQGSSYTSILLDGDRLIVSVHGYMYALDAMSGMQLWANEMAGFGFGIACLASVTGKTDKWWEVYMGRIYGFAEESTHLGLEFPTRNFELLADANRMAAVWSKSPEAREDIYIALKGLYP